MPVNSDISTTILVTKELNKRIVKLSNEYAKAEGLTRISKQQFIEKLVKVYEDAQK